MARDVASIAAVFYIYCHTEPIYATTLLVQCGYMSYILYIFISTEANLHKTLNEIKHQPSADI